MGARAVRGGGEGHTVAIAGSRAAAPQPEEGSQLLLDLLLLRVRVRLLE